MKIRFLGAAGTVTGSKTLVEADHRRYLIDAGLYQGIKNLRLRNWNPLPVEPHTINAIILTHAHIDHSGFLPALVKQGFRGKVYCTHASYEYCRVLLPDAGFLQEEDAAYAARKKFSKHEKPEPLFTEADAREALKYFEPVHFHERIDLGQGHSFCLTPTGHILGASAVSLEVEGKTIVFSGDVGRQHDLVMRPPEPLKKADYLVIESTYGNRLHDTLDAFEVLEKVVNQTIERGGQVLIPSFAVGRAQTLLHVLERLIATKRIPEIPIFLNSPMAIQATEIFCRHHKEHKLGPEDCARLDKMTKFVRTAEESIQLNNMRYPCVIISASGMASGGRVLHHLKTLAPGHKNSIVFAGFQAPGTRGDAIVNGATHIKIHGEYVPVSAEVHKLDGLSAHGDQVDLLTWLRQSDIQPKKVFINHGEPSASDGLRICIKDEFHWKVEVPEYLQEFEL